MPPPQHISRGTCEPGQKGGSLSDREPLQEFKIKTSYTGFIGRRDFLKSGATLLTASAAAVPAAIAASGSANAREFPDNMLYPGVEDEAYGSPSPHESDVVRKIFPQHGQSTLTASFSPLHVQKGIITPSGLHFGAHHSGVPDVDPETHELIIHGMTERALKFKASDLLRYPMTGGINFLECGGNTAPNGYHSDPQQMPLQYLYGLLSGAEWIGVPVKLLLQEAGIDPKAKWVIAVGADAGGLARSIPLEKLIDDAIIALYQNGERLRPAQGYPMRLFLPGWEGNTNVKWLHRLEVTDRPAFGLLVLKEEVQPDHRDLTSRESSLDSLGQGDSMKNTPQAQHLESFDQNSFPLQA